MRVQSLSVLAVLAAVFTAAASGCAQIEKESRLLKLDQAVRLYADSIRWGDFEMASGLIRRRDGKVSSMTAGRSPGVRVTGYASTISSVNEEHNEATVATSFDYYFPDTSRVRNVSQTDLWWFDPSTEKWYMDGSLPEFRP